MIPSSYSRTVSSASRSARGLARFCAGESALPSRSLRAIVPRCLSEFEVNFHSQLGAGAHGAVYLGRHLETNREVAIKTIATPSLPGKRRSCGSGADGLEQEREAVAQIVGESHPHVVECFGFFSGSSEEAISRGLELPEDVSVEDPLHYFVYELLEGETLQDRILDRVALEEREAKRVVRAVCEGLSFLHRQGVVHRDVKPDNVMLSQEEPKLIDFSCAGVMPRDDAIEGAHFDQKFGTAGFVAPEILSEKTPYSAKCDVYSLGCTVHSMLAQGRLPRRHPRLGIMTSLPETTSPDAIDFLGSVLCPDPSKRPSVEEVLRDPWLMNVE